MSAVDNPGGIRVSGPEEIAGALSAVEVSAARLERISQIHDAESQRVLYEMALALRLIAALVHVLFNAEFNDGARSQDGSLTWRAD